MPTRTDTSTTNQVTWITTGDTMESGYVILLDVNWDNIFDVDSTQIYVIGELISRTIREDTFTKWSSPRTDSNSSWWTTRTD